MTVTSRSTRRVAVSCFVLLVLGMAGCGAVQSILDLEKPTARIAGVGIADINLESATLTFEVEVSNPYPVPLPLVNVDYGLASGGTRFLAGQAQLQGAVPARGKKTVSVPATIVYTQLLAALKGVRPGSVLPYKADLGFSVSVFTFCALLCLGTLVLRRATLGGELGGDRLWAILSGCFFVSLWFVYIGASVAYSYGALA